MTRKTSAVAPPLTPEQARVRKIASVALNLAMAGDLEEAANYVNRLSGTDGLVVAMIGWIDTYLAQIHPDREPGRPIALRWLHTPTDQIETANDVSPSMRWAGWLVSARAADDEERFYGLLHAPAQGAELGDGIVALLHLVAHSLANPDLVHAAEERINPPRSTP